MQDDRPSRVEERVLEFLNRPTILRWADVDAGFVERAGYRPVRASECTQPCMRDLALSMSFLVKKFSGFTLSIG